MIDVPVRFPRSVLAVLLAIAVTLSGLAAASDARAARGMELALQDDATFVVGKKRVSRTRALDRARQLGVTRLRVNLLWSYSMVPADARRRRIVAR